MMSLNLHKDEKNLNYTSQAPQDVGCHRSVA